MTTRDKKIAAPGVVGRLWKCTVCEGEECHLRCKGNATPDECPFGDPDGSSWEGADE